MPPLPPLLNDIPTLGNLASIAEDGTLHVAGPAMKPGSRPSGHSSPMSTRRAEPMSRGRSIRPAPNTPEELTHLEDGRSR